MENKKKSQKGLKEAWRKFMVSLKRRPFMIPLVVLVFDFLVYSMHLTNISDTTAKIQGSGMGLCGFITMLFSMLSIVCFMNAFQYRKPVNKPMLILMFVMFAVIIGADYRYLTCIYAAVSRPDNPIVVTMNTVYIAYAEYFLWEHIYILLADVVLIALLPVYSRIIRNVKTSVEVEDNGDMNALELSEN